MRSSPLVWLSPFLFCGIAFANAICQSGNTATTTGDHWSRIPYLFESKNLPAQRYMPEVGNGHIATIVNGPYVHMNGLYNGRGPNSCRARIPSLVAFQFEVSGSAQPQLVDTSYTLNAKDGIFIERKQFKNPDVIVHREIFAHRLHDRLLVARVSAHRPANADTDITIQVNLENVIDYDDISSFDLKFSPTRQVQTQGEKKYYFADGFNRVTELEENVPTPVTVAWTPIPDNFTALPGEETDVVMIMAVSTYHADAVKALNDAMEMSYTELRRSHSEKWNDYWKHGMIEVDPAENFDLAQAVYGSFYYLMSSLPNEQDRTNNFIGLSPGGLARGFYDNDLQSNTDYGGHIFWDMETWMYPPILYFHPKQAELMLLTRNRTIERSRINSGLYGYTGLKYAWESAYSGNETSPWDPSGRWEIHITGDISFAIRQYLYLSQNKKEDIQMLNLKKIVLGIAEFWQSRTECEPKDGPCHINVVMPPDEYHYPVNDSIYTNYVAAVSLRLPEYVMNILGEKHENLEKWKKTADRLVLLKGSALDGRPVHLEFAGYTPGVMNGNANYPNTSQYVNTPPVVKQADVILLGFPFDMQMTTEYRKNDLDIYLNVTDFEGPAMTWGMFSVGYLEIGGHKDEADRLFNKNFENVVQPFGVWSEIPCGGGALNFHTGMGGFLQAIVNGYGGLRLHENYVEFKPHQLPSTKKWKIIGFKYLGSELDLEFDFTANKTKVTARQGDGEKLAVKLNSSKTYTLAKGSVELPLEPFVIRKVRDNDKFENSATRTETILLFNVLLVILATKLF